MFQKLVKAVTEWQNLINADNVCKYKEWLGVKGRVFKNHAGISYSTTNFPKIILFIQQLEAFSSSMKQLLSTVPAFAYPRSLVKILGFFNTLSYILRVTLEQEGYL